MGSEAMKGMVVTQCGCEKGCDFKLPTSTLPLRTTSIPSAAISNPKELLKAVMNEFYGAFSEKNGCWLTKDNDDTDCMKPYKMDIVGSDNNRRLFIIIAGQKSWMTMERLKTTMPQAES